MSRAFEGKTALVTGASRGIGRAIALQLAADGANIVVNYNTNADAANQVAEHARAGGVQAEVVQADVAVSADVERLVTATLDRFDMLTAVTDWVEKGTPPDSVIATGKAFPGRSRPLCAYPKSAQYSGQGDPNDARNFACR